MATHPPPTDPVSELYRGHALGLVRLALISTGDRQAAEDCVQEAFLGLYRNWDRLHDRDKALAYLRSSVLNRCRDVHRKSRFRRTEHVPPVWSAEAAVLHDEEQRAVVKALQRLPERQREALTLRYFLELTESEIAAAMDISVGTVKSTTSRGIASLERILKEDQ
ncbi:SigE family RNA polymerase sigma factor [Actinocorallia lasiicapitis]